jgi:hypothetical protein
MDFNVSLGVEALRACRKRDQEPSKYKRQASPQHYSMECGDLSPPAPTRPAAVCLQCRDNETVEFTNELVHCNELGCLAS